MSTSAARAEVGEGWCIPEEEASELLKTLAVVTGVFEVSLPMTHLAPDC